MCVTLMLYSCVQEGFVENMDHGKFFDLLYEGEDDVLKLDILEMVASVRQTYLFVDDRRGLHCGPS